MFQWYMSLVNDEINQKIDQKLINMENRIMNQVNYRFSIVEQNIKNINNSLDLIVEWIYQQSNK